MAGSLPGTDAVLADPTGRISCGLPGSICDSTARVTPRARHDRVLAIVNPARTDGNAIQGAVVIVLGVSGLPHAQEYLLRMHPDHTDPGWTRGERSRAVRHHLAHAESAIAPSGLDRPPVVVSNGMGETESLSMFGAADGVLERLATTPIGDSLGLLYSIATRFLGFQFNDDEYQVMGLAPYGEPDRFRSVFEKLAEAAVTTRVPAGDVHREEADVAATPQKHLSTLLVDLVDLVDLVEHWPERTGERQLCLAGRHVPQLQVEPVDRRPARGRRLFVLPASGDDGTVLGGACDVGHTEGCAWRRSPARSSPTWAPATPPTTSARRSTRTRTCAGATSAGPTSTTRPAPKTSPPSVSSPGASRWMEFWPRPLGGAPLDPRAPRWRPDQGADQRRGEVPRGVPPVRPGGTRGGRDQLFVTRGTEPDPYMLCTAHERSAR